MLISYVRPTSDSEAEETKGDTSRAMAPPPLPLAKKVSIWFGCPFFVQSLTFFVSAFLVLDIDD